MSFYPHTFRGAVETLGARESRKIANNTYLQKRDSETIAVRLHATDVIVYHSDGSVTLNSGGYETVTTKDRMNNYGPDGMRVYSEKRVWFVRMYGQEVPFVSGMCFFIDSERFYESCLPYRDAASDSLSVRKKEENRIDRFLRTLTDERLSEIVSGARQALGMTGDCLICRVELSALNEDGRKANLTDASHLVSHIDEDYWHASLILSGLVWAGYGYPEVVISHHDLVKRAMRRYLRTRLISSPKVSA